MPNEFNLQHVFMQLMNVAAGCSRIFFRSVLFSHSIVCQLILMFRGDDLQVLIILMN